MIDLNNLEAIKKLDPKDVLGSTNLFLEQCKQIQQTVDRFFLDPALGQAKNIVFSAMGGSAYGGQVVQTLYKKELKVPVIVNNEYNLPGFVNSNSLVFLTSYSGGTEETLASFEEAKKKGAKIIGLTTGGKLAALMKEQNYPVMVIDPQNNPSNQPRLGTGYIIFGTILVLNKLGFIHLESKEIEAVLDYLAKEQAVIRKEAIKDSQQLFNKIPVIFAASHLIGNAHILRNQLNETAKSFATYSLLPELNHHLMEGLKNPANKQLIIIIIKSDLYPERIKLRVNLTEDVVKKNNIPVLVSQPQGQTTLTQVLEILIWGGYLTFYLAMLYGQDPSLIPWVDYVKEQLSSSK